MIKIRKNQQISMKLILKLKWIMSRVYENSFQKTLFRRTKEERKSLIESFPEPKDRLERSYFQYQCQMKELPAIVRLMQNAAAVLLLPWVFLSGLFAKPLKVTGCDAVFLNLNEGIDKSIIPDSLQKEFPNMPEIKEVKVLYGKEERKWLFKLCRNYWRSPYFIIKCWLKMGLYASLITSFQPKAIISYEEFSFTSSVITAYCEERGVEHINVLHGERLYNTRDTFVSFHRFYVWDDNYRKMFLEMRAEKGQFRVELPPLVIWDSAIEEAEKYDMTYYVGNPTSKQLEQLFNVLEPLRRAGVKICIRIHPRFGDSVSINHLFKNFAIETPEISIRQSIARTGAVCAAMSTVLLQAGYAGRRIIVDDVSNPERFALLSELNYGILLQPHWLLSEVKPECFTLEKRGDKQNVFEC